MSWPPFGGGRWEDILGIFILNPNLNLKIKIRAVNIMNSIFKIFNIYIIKGDNENIQEYVSLYFLLIKKMNF